MRLPAASADWPVAQERPGHVETGRAIRIIGDHMRVQSAAAPHMVSTLE